ncbi:hypothetical protein AB0O07_13850 [Streptomyces sp. NPDC093085]|uniref:hypothetical protein n=1 Tax=Streptomyces sp. NPDC093085 TaxID=3155068 RepID=UPI003443E2B8
MSLDPQRLFPAAPSPPYEPRPNTKNHLWREAGVSRAAMNRATKVLADWDNRIGHSPARVQDRKR